MWQVFAFKGTWFPLGGGGGGGRGIRGWQGMLPLKLLFTLILLPAALSHTCKARGTLSSRCSCLESMASSYEGKRSP